MARSSACIVATVSRYKVSFFSGTVGHVCKVSRLPAQIEIRPDGRVDLEDIYVSIRGRSEHDKPRPDTATRELDHAVNRPL